MPYPLVGRFKELCALYRWVKFNYITFYFAVSAYTYCGLSDMPITLEEATVSSKKKYSGAIRNNTPNIGPIHGADKFHFVWNLDNIIKEESATLNYFESSLHAKRAVINKNKYIIFFRIPKDDRSFIRTDHVSAVTAAQDLDSYLKNVLGAKYRRVPTAIYGVSDDC